MTSPRIGGYSKHSLIKHIGNNTMLTSTSLKHPTVQRKIKEATTKAIRWAKGTSDTYNSVVMLTVGKTTVFIRANNKGKVVSAIA